MKTNFKIGGFAVLLFVLAGCANQSDNPATPTPSTTAPVSPAAISHCISSQLTIIDGRYGGAMGHLSDDGIAFKNVSATSCTLKGYPNLQMLDATGNRMTIHLNKGTSYTVQATPENLITLLPGGEAMFDLGYSDSTGYGNLKCPTSNREEITPPGADHVIVVHWSMNPYGGDIPNLHCGEVTVSPVYSPPGH